MFRIFGKDKGGLKKWELVLLRAIVDALPEEFSFLEPQITADFLLSSRPHTRLGSNWKVITCDAEQYEEMQKPGYDCKITNITALFSSGRTMLIELDLNQSVLIGYNFTPYENFGPDFTVDIDTMRIIDYPKHKSNDIKEVLLEISKSFDSLEALRKSSRIETNLGDVFIIDGNDDLDFVAIDPENKVYGIKQEPPKAELLFESKDDLVYAIENHEFDIDEYLNR